MCAFVCATAAMVGGVVHGPSLEEFAVAAKCPGILALGFDTAERVYLDVQGCNIPGVTWNVQMLMKVHARYKDDAAYAHSFVRSGVMINTFLNSIRHGHYDIANWIAATFDIQTLKGLQGDGPFLAYLLFAERWDGARWLCKKFPLCDNDLKVFFLQESFIAGLIYNSGQPTLLDDLLENASPAVAQMLRKEYAAAGAAAGVVQ